MKIVYCSEPFLPREVDEVYRGEAEAARENGFEIELVDFEELERGDAERSVRTIKTSESEEQALYRGWMLKPDLYEQLYMALGRRNLKPVNDPDSYRHCYYFPESYDLIKEITPASISLTVDKDFSFAKLHSKLSAFGNRPLIVKDYVKSRKHEWLEACFIPAADSEKDVERVVGHFLELQGGDLNEGLVLREYVQFDPIGVHPQSGMPLTREYRLFYFDSKLIAWAPYWDTALYADQASPDIPFEKFTQVARRICSRFFTMDVARTVEGDWLVIELGDGGVAGFPEGMNPLGLYAGISRFADQE